MVLAKEQTNRSVEKNKDPRNKLPQTQSIDLWQKSKGHTIEQR